MSNVKHEWRKAEKALYLPGGAPVFVDVPPMRFFAVQGHGRPGSPQFQACLQALYSLSYTVRMMPKQGIVPEGYEEYTVYPLEGIWSIPPGQEDFRALDKDALNYTLMIRQPDFVTASVLDTARTLALKKDKGLTVEQVSLLEMHDGPSVQMLHTGPYDDEPESFARMDAYLAEKGLVRTGAEHREIYLSDPRRVKPESLRTVLRYGVRPASPAL